VPDDKMPLVTVRDETTPSTFNTPKLSERLLDLWAAHFGGGEVEVKRCRAVESYATASAGTSGRELPHSVPSGDGHSGTQPASPAGSFDDLVRGIPEQHGGGLSRG